MLLTNKYVKNINGEAVIIIYYWSSINQTKQHDAPDFGCFISSQQRSLCAAENQLDKLNKAFAAYVALTRTICDGFRYWMVSAICTIASINLF